MTTIDRPAARYGSEQPRRTSGTSGKVVAVVAVILVALIVVFLGRYVMQRQAQPISATLVSHERVDDTTSRVWFDAQRDDSAIDAPPTASSPP